MITIPANLPLTLDLLYTLLACTKTGSLNTCTHCYAQSRSLHSGIRVLNVHPNELDPSVIKEEKSR